jgi:hypothetical protein
MFTARLATELEISFIISDLKEGKRKCRLALSFNNFGEILEWSLEKTEAFAESEMKEIKSENITIMNKTIGLFYGLSACEEKKD